MRTRPAGRPARPGRRLAALLLAALVAVAAASPGASAARTALSAARAPAAWTAPAPAASGGGPDLGNVSLLWTARGRVILDKIVKDGYLAEFNTTYAATWLALPDVSPADAGQVDQILRDNWGENEEAATEVQVVTAQTIKKNDPDLYAELLAAKKIVPNGTVLQTVGRNWSQAPGKNQGLLALHAEIMALKAQVKAKYVEAALKAGKTPAQIKASLRKLDNRLRKLGEGAAYRTELQRARRLDQVKITETALSAGDLVTNQPCGNKSDSKCSAVAKDADYIVPTQTMGGLAIGTDYLLGVLHRTDEALARNDEAAALEWAGRLTTIAEGLQATYQTGVAGTKPAAKVQLLTAARKQAMDILKEEDFNYRYKEQPKVADKVNASRKALNKYGEGPAQVQKRVDAAKKDDQKKKKQACAVTGMILPVPGLRAAAPAAFPLKDPCDGEEESGLIKGLMSSDLGGVDFSTLQMRYMSDDGGHVKYAFSGLPGAPGVVQNVGSGFDAVAAGNADLRTWLVLDPSKFWVNLNPAEPDRIIDPALGRTNAGRALLDADYQMKRTAGKLLDPNTGVGAKYWDAMEAASDKPCAETRLWIVPGDVEVREDGSSLYILKADLAVKAQATEIGNTGKLSCTTDPATQARSERLEQTLIVPEVAKAVNADPAYAPIRRAFLARVVAQWIRKRHGDGHRTSFDGLIGSGDLGSAQLTDGWRPRQVYDSYVRSIQNGDFTFTRTVERGGVRMRTRVVTGGVDFSKIPMTPVDAARMDREHPGLPRTVRASASRPASAADGSIWLGGTDASPGNGLWSRTSGTVRAFANGRTGVAAIIVVALVVVVFGLRTGSGRRRRAS
ncbi:hypothetical protein [Actinomadura sp. NPDC048394]|uniref:hypothetical protein n=1 Tax=Actinomadura sp. NPDC048394 TaxID=3158223 RepID=UPI0033E76106